jgi:hypothetical protein
MGCGMHDFAHADRLAPLPTLRLSNLRAIHLTAGPGRDDGSTFLSQKLPTPAHRPLALSQICTFVISVAARTELTAF